jgi:hypothetical protein
MYYRNDRLKDPGAWAVIRDPVSHELAVLTLLTGRLVPSTFQKTNTFSGQPLSIENAAISSARIDTTQYGLSHPDEKVEYAWDAVAAGVLDADCHVIPCDPQVETCAMIEWRGP